MNSLANGAVWAGLLLLSFQSLTFGQSSTIETLPPLQVSAARATAKELSIDGLVADVLARNPSLPQMIAAWEAARARYPQVISLDDPMVAGILGPGSFGSRDVEFAYRLEASQKFPWPGKLRLKGQMALAEAGAANADIDDMRLQLIEAAKNAFFEYYLVGRLLVINTESARLLKEFKENADKRYAAGLVTQQDVLLAQVEIDRQKERLLELEQIRKVVLARINALLHAPPDAPLLEPAAKLPVPPKLPSVDELRQVALDRRPDIQALARRIAAEEANLGLALKERFPDVEVMAAYDAFWQPKERDLRTMVGLRLNLPIRVARRGGLIAEAQARIAMRRAELDKLMDQVQFQVHEAYAQVERSENVTKLYETSILPSAQSNIKTAQSLYTTGKLPFLNLIDAQRNLIMLRERYYEAIATVHRARATLERAVAGSESRP
ncbi:MAG: TolC family protein [Gemmataceae bacterium]|nr:TolC family protein [Gemmataceae bacterium]